MRKRTTIFLAIFVAQYCALADVLPRLRLASGVDRDGDTAALGGSAPVVSADGRRVAFLSRSPNLVTNRTGGEINVYLRLTDESNTVLVSRSLTGTGGNDHSVLPTLSSNGNLVAFQSTADNLVLNDTNQRPDVFVYDAAIGEVRLVSASSQGVAGAGASTLPLISGDGRYVIFESTAPDLVANDFNNARDIFRADLLTGGIRLISVPGDTGPNGDSQLHRATPDGRFVVFWSSSIAAGSTNRLGQLYVRDMDAEITHSPTAGVQVNGVRQFIDAITPDGRYLVFRDLNIGDTAAAGYVYWTDLITGSRLQLGISGAAGSGLAISADGTKVIFPASNGLYYRDISVATNRLLVPYQQSPAFSESISSWVTDFTVDPGFTRLVYITILIGKGSALLGYDFRFNTTELYASNAMPPVSLSPSGQFLAYELAPEAAGTNDLNGAGDVYLQWSDLSSPYYRSNYLVSAAHPALREVTGRGSSTLLPNSLTAAGDRILFLSTDSSFVRNDTNYWHDLFAHDYRSNATWSAHPFRSNRTWNVHGPLVPTNPAATNFVSLSNSAHSCSVSADGAFAAFVRSTGNQLRGPTNVYRVDLQSGSVTAIAEGASPSISEDGRRIAYELSSATTSLRDIIVRDFVEPASFTASIRYDGSRGGNGSSWAPQLTLGGQWVVFLSLATDLVQPEVFPTGVRRLFARDLVKSRTRLLSLDGRGNPSVEQATNFIISANGRYVVFSLGTALYRHDLLASGRVTNSLVCSNCTNPSATADGRLALYQTTSRPSTIFLADLDHPATEQIAPDASEGSISQDGRFVVFTSRASNLAPSDGNGVKDVFLRDRWRGATHLLSATPSGASGNGPSSGAFISADGRRVAFQSFASDLVPGDFNNRRDVFYVILDPSNTDNDLLDDDWEEYYFGGLPRNGLADFDGDGYSDWTEQKLGSNPLDRLSNLRITESISLPLGTSLTRRTSFSWQSAPGKLYRAQVSTNLNTWLPIPGDIIPGGPTAKTTHMAPNPPHTIFYRVTFLE